MVEKGGGNPYGNESPSLGMTPLNTNEYQQVSLSREPGAGSRGAALGGSGVGKRNGQANQQRSSNSQTRGSSAQRRASAKASQSNPPPGAAQSQGVISINKLAKQATGAALAIQKSNNFYSQRQGDRQPSTKKSKMANAVAAINNASN